MFRDNVIFVFGGYNKDLGTLDSIERFEIDRKKITLIDLKMPAPLRRFASVKISQTKVLILGGLTNMNKDSDVVYCFDSEEGSSLTENGKDLGPQYSVEVLDKIDRAGVIESPIIADTVGSLHLYIEQKAGTAPPVRSVYSFLEYS